MALELIIKLKNRIKERLAERKKNIAKPKK